MEQLFYVGIDILLISLLCSVGYGKWADNLPMHMDTARWHPRDVERMSKALGYAILFGVITMILAFFGEIILLLIS